MNQKNLTKIVEEIEQRSIIPKDEDIKKYLLQSLEEKLEDDGSRNTMNKKAEIRTAIDILFSTNWWISENKRMDSWEKVRTFFGENAISWMPEPVRNRICQVDEPTSVVAQNDQHLDTHPYVDKQS